MNQITQHPIVNQIRQIMKRVLKWFFMCVILYGWFIRPVIAHDHVWHLTD